MHRFLVWIGFLAIFMFNGCGNSQKSPATERTIGYFIDAPVVNLTYQCGDIIGKTDGEGKFECDELPVEFWVGRIKVGSLSQMTQDSKVYPQDLVGVDREEVSHPEVLKIASLLQSLDDDGDITVSINIPDNIQLESNKALHEMTQEEINELLEEHNISPVSLEDAEKHLRESLARESESSDIEQDSSYANDSNDTSNSDTSSSETSENSSEENTESADATVSNTTESDDSSTTESRRDTTPPAQPTLTVTPTATNQDTISVEVNGELGAILFVNSNSQGTLSTGKLTVTLDTSGADGYKDFNLTLKDSSNNASDPLNLRIQKDTIAPAMNATVNSLATDDTTPPLGGNLPSGDNDTNTTNYTVKVKIADALYDATNNQDGTWSIADDTIDPLDTGYHDVNITVTDEANNTSSTILRNKIEINNTGFLIDSAIEGIKYVSGAFSGYTDKDGLFKYDKGVGVTFYIGDTSTGIPLGMAVEKVDPHNDQRRIITLFDLSGSQDETNPRVVNMGKLLQSLDVDKDVSNGITIDDKTKESIALLGMKNKINFDQDIEAFHNDSEIYNFLNDLADHFGEHRGLLRTEDVQSHMVAVRDNTLATKTAAVTKVRGEKEEITVLTGVFKSTTGVVEGLEYRSGNRFGRTNVNGEFEYEEGKTVKFFIYQLELGITQAKAVVTPADLVSSTSFDHPRPRNIIRLLNAFDAVSNDGKVTLDDAVREALEIYRSQIDLNLPDGKANAELNIPAGKDEFGTQFEDFEIGKDILDEIVKLRG